MISLTLLKNCLSCVSIYIPPKDFYKKPLRQIWCLNETTKNLKLKLSPGLSLFFIHKDLDIFRANTMISINPALFLQFFSRMRNTVNVILEDPLSPSNVTLTVGFHQMCARLFWWLQTKNKKKSIVSTVWKRPDW